MSFVSSRESIRQPIGMNRSTFLYAQGCVQANCGDGERKDVNKKKTAQKWQLKNRRTDDRNVQAVNDKGKRKTTGCSHV